MNRSVIIIISVGALIVCGAAFVAVFKIIARVFKRVSDKGAMVFKTVSDKGAILGENIQKKMDRVSTEMALRGQEAVCPSCGAPNTNANPFCEYCGTSLVKDFGSPVGIVFGKKE